VPLHVNMVTPDSAATALASSVLPVPGEPASSTPPMRATPRSRSSAGFLR
jgi:hypothetical protein